MWLWLWFLVLLQIIDMLNSLFSLLQSVFFLGCGRTPQQPVTVHTRYMFIPDSCIWESPDTVTKLIPVSKACFCLSLKTHAQTSLWNSGILGSDVAEPSTTASEGGLQCAGWKAVSPATSGGLQPAVTPWSSSDYNQQDRSAQTLAYSATPTLTADVYMQTLCPSYTMLTYTHTPLLTNFGVSRRQICVWTKVCLKFHQASLAFVTPEIVLPWVQSPR